MSISQALPMSQPLETPFDDMYICGVSQIRDEAWERFKHQGLPSRKLESWRYTDLKTALRSVYPLGSRVKYDSFPPREHESHRLVIIDGFFHPELSDLNDLPQGVRCLNIKSFLADLDNEARYDAYAILQKKQEPSIDLNTALLQEGVAVIIDQGVSVVKPIELLLIFSNSNFSFTRNIIHLHQGASARFIETVKDTTLTGKQFNHLLLANVESNARLDLGSNLSGQADQTIGALSVLLSLAENSQFSSFSLVGIRGFIRRQIYANLAKKNAKIHLSGVTLSKSDDHIDTTIEIDHLAENSTSIENFRSILSDRSSVVFQGKIIVRSEAQHTSGQMTSKAILLSDNSTMYSKPELEIMADDVKCSHGSTIGQLDKDQLFYLMARGLSLQDATNLLIESFASDPILNIEDDYFKSFFHGRLIELLGSGAPA